MTSLESAREGGADDQAKEPRKRRELNPTLTIVVTGVIVAAAIVLMGLLIRGGKKPRPEWMPMVSNTERAAKLWEQTHPGTPFPGSVVNGVQLSNEDALARLLFNGRRDAQWQGVMTSAPKDFSEVPDEVKARLELLACRVAQPEPLQPSPINIVQGEFAAKGQTDWAALCLSAKGPRVFVVWGGPARCPDLIERSGVGGMASQEGRSVFAGFVQPASVSYIQERQEKYGGHLPAQLDHDGIEDAFIDKASVVHYCDGGRWKHITGGEEEP